MSRWRGALSRIYNWVDRPADAQEHGMPTSTNDERHASGMAQMTMLIYRRQTAGESTSLRQLHSISGFSQPAALKIAAELESSGIIHIDHNLVDAFESTITLSKETAMRLDKQFGKG